ncbi:uncharacterized protein BBA_04831 [Beauveria bassiana ARSEF 2860]|uniref:Uncharacterized protein n=1 Tax=Beauveria bassiana (strain ARSEF 2860) TaxID=655819 RepID=J5JM10_BEAB2|nr:uncharacterized protein BBA_04831 [Beauveria bassiana ARSEF 2860]EJP66338.1 hypothetical protein BBA_04831 [Beauveria bassiana ARSEF 2860]
MLWAAALNMLLLLHLTFRFETNFIYDWKTIALTPTCCPICDPFVDPIQLPAFERMYLSRLMGHIIVVNDDMDTVFCQGGADMDYMLRLEVFLYQESVDERISCVDVSKAICPFFGAWSKIVQLPAWVKLSRALVEFFESSLESGVDALFLKIQTRHWSRKPFVAGPCETRRQDTIYGTRAWAFGSTARTLGDRKVRTEDPIQKALGSSLRRAVPASPNGVWRLAHALQPEDEAELGVAERVPVHFTKETMQA